MTEKSFDLVGIGNAIVDILAYKDESFLSEQSLPKGSMALVDESRANQLYDLLGAATECAGGSAANTLAGFSMLGGKSAFIGKVKHDQLGDIFRKSLERVGVTFPAAPASDGLPTAKCLIMVTEEAGKFGNKPKIERTMATYLGASVSIGEDDIDEDTIRNAKIIYFEGYLWDSEPARNAVKKAIRIAKESGTKVAFTLSDFLCVERHHDEFIALVDNDIDILFANEHEIKALCGTSDIQKILYRLSGKCEVVLITRSEKGSYILMDDSVYPISAERVDDVYDVTGAGDLYASGFLYGYVNKFDPEKSGRLASLCAAEVIKYLGARPVTKLTDMLEKL